MLKCRDAIVVCLWTFRFAKCRDLAEKREDELRVGRLGLWVEIPHGVVDALDSSTMLNLQRLMEDYQLRFEPIEEIDQVK